MKGQGRKLTIDEILLPGSRGSPAFFCSVKVPVTSLTAKLVTVSTNYSIGDQLDVRVEKIVPRGYGIAFVEGLTILVALAAPGDELTVRLTEVKKRLAFAEIVSVNVPSPQRQTPPCPHFGTCGGCDLQQLTYEAQLEAKIAIIRDSLHRIGKIDFEGEIRIIRHRRSNIAREFAGRSTGGLRASVTSNAARMTL